MNRTIKTQAAFLGRSLIWSSLLFFVLMLLINIDDVKRHLAGNYITITSNQDTIMQKVAPSTVSAKQQTTKPKV